MKAQDTDILRRSSAFKFLSDEHFAALEPLLKEENYEFGDLIVRQGDPADSFYILSRGRARALKVKSDGGELPIQTLISRRSRRRVGRRRSSMGRRRRSFPIGPCEGRRRRTSPPGRRTAPDTGIGNPARRPEAG